MKTLFAVLGAITFFTAQTVRADTTGDCHVGAYRLADGRAGDKGR